MKSKIRLLILFTCLHFVGVFLINICGMFTQIYFQRKGVFLPAGEVGVMFAAYNFLILPISLFFTAEHPELNVPQQLPLWASFINSIIWGALLMLLVIAVKTILNKNNLEISESVKVTKSHQRISSKTSDIIGLFFIHFLSSLALFFYELAFQIDNTVNILVSYLGKISRFPSIPFHTSEELWSQPNIDFINRLLLLIGNSMTFTILATIFFYAYRNLKSGSHNRNE